MIADDVRRRHRPLRRHRRLHAVRRAAARRRRSWTCSNDVFSALRRARRPARAREDQDDRRRLHGRRRASRSPRDDHAGRDRRDGARRCAQAVERAARDGRRRARDPRSASTAGPVVAGVIGAAQVQLRRLGRHGQHGEPHGEPRRARRDPGDRARLRAPARALRVERARPDRGQEDRESNMLKRSKTFEPISSLFHR